MNTEVLYTPVLLLAFNRPENTKKVFEVIRKVKPQKLYVAVDAPREGRQDDIINSQQVKKIVQDVDWPCETHYLFQEKNLGCSLSGVTAWRWLFEHEDRMIFVEDDGFSSTSAYYFVQDLLERYKDDARIGYVSPINYGFKNGEYSYFFSRYFGGTYFMGTWKRVFDLYDYDLDSYNEVRKQESFKKSFPSTGERLIFQMMFDGYRKSVLQNRRHNTYDLQMSYLVQRYNLWSICSNISMVRNIGFAGGANTSVKDEATMDDPYKSFPVEEIETIKYAPELKIDESFEKRYYKKRVLQEHSWIQVYSKLLFLRYFGDFYTRYIKKFRR